MSLRYSQHHELRRIQQMLHASDPHLCSMLVIFSRLAAGEDMPAWERMPRSLPRAVRLLASILPAVARLSACILLTCGRVVRQTVLRGVAGRRFLPAGLRLAASAWLAGRGRPAPSAGLSTGEPNS
jgi:hypothetical protein